MSRYVRIEDRNIIDAKIQKHDDLYNDYLTKVEELGSGGSFKGKLTQFFNLTNAYRNAANRELNQVESIVQQNIKRTPLAKYPEVKKAINTDYVNYKKVFSEEDNKLRKRMSEVLNAPK